MMQSEVMRSNQENVYVRLLIDDGNQFELTLRSDSPLLHDLIQAIVSRSQNKPGGKLFKIPIDDGQSSFFFSSESLVALATEPQIEIPEKLERLNQHSLTEKSPPSKIIQSSFVQIDNFLDRTENQALVDYMLAHESDYMSSGQERSLTESFAPWRTILLNRTGAELPNVLKQLKIPGFPLPKIEAGEFPGLNNSYRVDSDNSTPETALRVINFIYYFSHEATPQNTGELRIYDSQIVNKNCLPAKSFKTLEPRNNCIIFFFSSYSHEVLPVSSPKVPWADCCFKFNGWLHRPDSPEINN